MHNLRELESRWFRYKLKSYLPYTITIIFGLILVVTLVLIYISVKSSNVQETPQEKVYIQEKTQEDEVKIKESAQESEPIKQDKAKKVETQEVQSTRVKEVEPVKDNSKMILSPSFDFMKKLKTDSVTSYNTQENINDIQDKTNDEVEVKNEELSTQTKEIQKPKINISMQETKNDINDVIKRFKKNNNPALSLFIAKKYYKVRNYQQAYNYALITNEINNDIEQSWIIFAKSLVKLNKKNKAIKTLTKYVKHSGSGNAKVLLDDIKAGKFK
jgi:predicted Zn-dependent protease